MRSVLVVFTLVALISVGLGSAQVAMDATEPSDSSSAIGVVAPDSPSEDAPMWVTSDGYHVAPATPWTTLEEPPGSENVQFRCPDGPYGGLPLPSDVPGTTSAGGVQDTIVVYGCPIRIIDQDDAFGNAQIVLDHNNHNQVAFATLHGLAASNGPSDYSRQGTQTQTLFTSGSQGIDWEDQPIQSNRAGMSGRFGESTDVVMDDAGNIYVADLWVEGAGERWNPYILLYKGGQANEPSGFTRSGGAYDNPNFLQLGNRFHSGRDDHNNISRVDLAHIPSFAPILPPEEGDNGTVGSEEGAQNGTTEDQNGNVTIRYDEANRTDERVVAVWHEATSEPQTSSLQKSAWIDAAWTHTGPGNDYMDWDRLDPKEAIGPCRQSSNPAVFENKIYVACVVDAGYGYYYPERSRARIGDVDLWSIDVFNGNTTFEGTIGGVEGGRPFLAIAEDGYMGIVSYMKSYDGEGTFLGLEVDAAFKWHSSKTWSRLGGDPGADLRRMGGGADYPIVDADITAFEMTDDEKTSVIVYKERKLTDPDEEPQPPDPEGQDDPLVIIDDVFTEYDKYFVAFNQCNYPIAAFRMELGHGVDSYNAGQYQENPATFNDVNDGLFLTREPTGEELMYFAINDYGAMQYGAVVTNSIAEFCPVGFPPPVVPPVPVPQALTIFNPVNMAVGATMAVPAVAMVTYLLRQKSKSPSYVTAGDE